MNNSITQNLDTFKHVIVTEIELKDGTKTQMITIFNDSKIGHDEVNIGVKTALEHTRKTTNMKSTFSCINEGGINPVFFFDKTAIQDYRPELDPSLNPHLRSVM